MGRVTLVLFPLFQLAFNLSFDACVWLCGPCKSKICRMRVCVCVFFFVFFMPSTFLLLSSLVLHLTFTHPTFTTLSRRIYPTLSIHPHQTTHLIKGTQLAFSLFGGVVVAAHTATHFLCLSSATFTSAPHSFTFAPLFKQ